MSRLPSLRLRRPQPGNAPRSPGATQCPPRGRLQMPDPLLTCLCGCPAPRDHSVASGHGRAGPLAGPPAAARGNSRARDGPCWVVPSGRGRGREDEGCPGGGGERRSHGRARTPTGTVIFSRSLDRRLPGLPEPRQAGRHPGRRPPPAQVRGSSPAGRPWEETSTWLTHTRGGQMSPRTGSRCHFVSFQETQARGWGRGLRRGTHPQSPPPRATGRAAGTLSPARP